MICHRQEGNFDNSVLQSTDIGSFDCTSGFENINKSFSYDFLPYKQTHIFVFSFKRCTKNEVEE